MLKTTLAPAKVAELVEAAADASEAELEASQNEPAYPHLHYVHGIGIMGDRAHPRWRAPPRRKKFTSRGARRKFNVMMGLSNAAGVRRSVHSEPPSPKRIRSDMKTGEHVDGGDGGDCNDHAKGKNDEVRVLKEFGVADKMGQRHQIIRQRTVSTSFGSDDVDGYTNLLSSVLSGKIDELVSGIPGEVGGGGCGGGGEKGGGKANCRGNGMRKSHEGSRETHDGEVVGVISYSEELSRNVVRSGVPPPLPRYTKVAMWRGEDVCLEQLGAGEMQELIVGITWCEPKSGKMGKVDLDLSVMVSANGCTIVQ